VFNPVNKLTKEIVARCAKANIASEEQGAMFVAQLKANSTREVRHGEREGAEVRSKLYWQIWPEQDTQLSNPLTYSSTPSREHLRCWR
jgi:hypothetical protein